MHQNTLPRYALLLTAGTVIAGLAIAGPLTPPAGPVSPTYKTLDEVEPRIPVNSINTPGDAACMYRITQPGSYYLTGNITGQNGHTGIEIVAPDVTLDLKGYRLVAGEGSLRGIYVPVLGLKNIVIRNGTVRGWSPYGVDTSYASDCRLEDLTASDCGFCGFALADKSTITRCVASGNSAAGFQSNGLVEATSCTASLNGTDGFSLQHGNLTDCAASDNSASGITILGPGLVTRCVCSSNHGDGISAQVDVVVTGCTATNSGANGIHVLSNALVTGNTSCSNGSATPDGAGIRASGAANHIDGNCTNNNVFGIRCDTAGNVVVRNNARTNASGNYSFPAGGDFGQILVNPGAGFAATNPWANFSN